MKKFVSVSSLTLNFFVRLKNVDVFYFDDITQMRWVPILCRRKIIFLLFYPLNLRTHKHFQMWHKLISAILHQLYLLLLLLSYSEFISAHFFSHLFVSLCKNISIVLGWLGEILIFQPKLKSKIVFIFGGKFN